MTWTIELTECISVVARQHRVGCIGEVPPVCSFSFDADVPEASVETSAVAGVDLFALKLDASECLTGRATNFLLHNFTPAHFCTAAASYVGSTFRNVKSNIGERAVTSRSYCCDEDSSRRVCVFLERVISPHY